MRKIVLVPLFLLLGLAAPLACTTTVRCPPAVSEPVDAFILTAGMTSSLALPAEGGGLVRYAYGDWRYYARAENTIPNGVAALLWPTQGTLGRGELPPASDAERVRAAARAERVHHVTVARDAAAALRTRLDRAFEAHRHTEVDNRDYGLRFVHHERSYTWFHNSNHTVAAWLRELGCEVRGPAFSARWRVEVQP